MYVLELNLVSGRGVESKEKRECEEWEKREFG
jgi:hypothetical protein